MSEHQPRQAQAHEIEAPSSSSGERLDRFLAAYPELQLSRTRVQKLIEQKLVLVDGQHQPGKYKLHGNEKISLSIPDDPPSEIVGEEIDLEIVYADDDLIVVNKPAGLVTHPAIGHRSGTLVNGLVHRFGVLSTLGGADRPGIVHRLDKETSGLLVVARNDQSYQILQQGIQNREVRRVYRALVCGHMPEKSGRIDLPIGRSIKNRTRMAVTNSGGRPATTDYTVTDSYRSYDVVEITLVTGRTHQIRVHFAHLGHPVFGDPDYGGREKWHKGIFGPERPLAKKLLDSLNRQALHAARLSFAHPISGAKLDFEADLPEDFQALLAFLDTEGR